MCEIAGVDSLADVQVHYMSVRSRNRSMPVLAFSVVRTVRHLVQRLHDLLVSSCWLHGDL
jgi:hypothetical protein